MKKVIFSMIAVVIMAFAFVSCGNNGNGGNKGDAKEQGLVGNWYYNDNTYYTFRSLHGLWSFGRQLHLLYE